MRHCGTCRTLSIGLMAYIALSVAAVEEVAVVAAAWLRSYEKSGPTPVPGYKWSQAFYRPFTIEPPNLRAKS
jgi:hypothetical protein